jgi:hypothetical protein
VLRELLQMHTGLELHSALGAPGWNCNLNCFGSPADLSVRIGISEWPSRLHTQPGHRSFTVMGSRSGWLGFFVNAGLTSVRHSHIDASPALAKCECLPYGDL